MHCTIQRIENASIHGVCREHLRTSVPSQKVTKRHPHDASDNGVPHFFSRETSRSARISSLQASLTAIHTFRIDNQAYSDTKIDLVPGVEQKPLSKCVPHVDRSWQLWPHPPRSQNPTFFVADRQLVPDASMHVGPPLYTEHEPPQTPPTRFVQYVTVVVPSRGESGLIGLPMYVRLASVFLSQCIISSCETRYVAGWGVVS